MIVYNDRLSNFEELLNKDNSVSIHRRNVQCLATGMFKVMFFNVFTLVYEQEKSKNNM